MWQNKYIGIPYKDYGRDSTGIDCWGLACLVYREQFNIDLPSFSEPGIYDADDRTNIAEIIAQNTEGWSEVAVPEAGDLVLFRIMGQPSHIGIAVSATHFIHAIEGHACAIESFDSISWKHRRVGFYKYTPQVNSNNLVAVPHPLRTQKVIMNVAYGSTLQQVYDSVNQQHNISDRLKKHITIIKNSKVVPESEWGTTVVQHGDTLEYRAVPGKGVGRLVLTLLVIYIAVQTGMYFGGTEATIFGTGVGTATAAQAAMIQAGITFAGTMLVNAIMPIRPPEQPGDPGSAKAQLILGGAVNRANPYGAIPFVLGKMRVTPPLGAQNFVRFGELTTGIVDNADASYLDMLLVWGYGPLNIDETTMRIGEISIYDYSTTPPTPNFEKLKYITLDRKSTESALEQVEFDTIYGKDVQQVYKGVPLTCTGLPPVAEGNWTPSTTPGPFIVAAFQNPCDKVSVALHFPQGLRAIKTQGAGAGNSLAAPVSVTLEYRTDSASAWNHWTTQTIGGTLTLNSTVYHEGSTSYDEFGGNYYYIAPYTENLSNNLILDGAPRKDAFTWTITKDRITDGVAAWHSNQPLQVRVRRNTGDNTEPSDSYRYSHEVVFQNATAISNDAPAQDPKYCKIAKTALTIQATDQLNNQMDGVNAIVQTWCLDWNGSAWVEAATSNPASLFRYVLQSAANPQRVLDADVASKIDLVQLQYWHTFCNQTRTDPQTGEAYRFEFNDIIAGQRGVLDILRDICAAGKASPALIDGRWTVVIDEPRTQVIQHFSPHNSWGFESTKMLPKFPDALKVQFYDQDNDYEQRELIIPFAGKTVANSELFETIQLPGVTKAAQAKDHARWHMAQTKLRPEVYTLNSDLEYLVCNRGDRVKVTHDVPLWGLGSGRIKEVYNNLNTYSEELNTNWTNGTGATWQYSSALSPENTTTALGVDGLNGTGITATGTTLYQSVTGLTIGKTYTFSAYIRTKTGTHPGVRLRLNQTGNSVLGTPVAADQTWQRISVTATAITTSFNCVVGTSGTIGNFYIWGAMLNEGTTALSYVKSTNLSPFYGLILDEDVPMQALTSYTIRIRSSTGASVARTIVAKNQDGYYTNIVVTSPVTTTEVAAGDLFLFGELNQESQDLLVLNIEPGANKTARLTLVDYGVTDTYNIFTDYLTYSNSVIFESQVTLPPGLLVAGFNTKKPTITDMVSDETVMELVAPGVFAYKLQVSFTNADDLPNTTSHVEAQIDYQSATDGLGIRTITTEFTKGSVLFSDVEESSAYKVRLRYAGSDGRYGRWTDWATHTIVGKTNPPSAVTGFIYEISPNSGKLILDWNNNPEIDVVGYEIRYADSGWGSDSLYVYKGSNSQVEVDPRVIYAYTTWFIRAYDANNNYSTTSNSINFTVSAPIKVNETLVEYNFADTSLTSATVTITWAQATTTNFSLSGYKVSYDDKEIFVNATTITLPADWVGIRNVSIKTVDITGLESAVATIPIPKFAPNPISIDTLKPQVIDNTVLLYWELPAKTTLPISHVLLRKSKKVAGVTTYTWNTAENIGEKSGTFTSFNELSRGEYIYWIRTVDTDGVESTEISKTVQVAQPPDYIFNAEFDSTLLGTKTNAAIDTSNNSIILPVNSTETWEEHFEGPDISSYPLWQFSSTAEAWTAGGATNTWSSGGIIHSSTSLDPYFASPTPLAIGGGQFPRVQVMLKRLSGSGWDGSLFYANQYHGFRELGKGTLSVTMPIGEYKLLEWNMASMTSQDWTTSTISSFRIDFGSSASDSFRIEYVRIIPAAGITAVKSYSWLTPQAQITAGYPYYLQPGTTTGSYVEVFDYQTILASSQVSVEATINTIAGSGNIKYYLSYSTNGNTYTTRQLTTSLFATNFRYIKLEVEVDEYSANTLVEIKALTVRLDSKKISDSGKVTVLPADVDGTIVNLSKEFVDIDTVNLTANASVSVPCVYNLKDFVQTSTYSIASNVCTITTPIAHGLLAGQNIRTTFIDGTGVNGIYTITSVPSTTTMTISITASNTSSGGVYVYPNSFTVYAFDSDGVRMTTPVSVSWQIQGF